MRGKGEGSVFKDTRGLWTAVVELPPLDGKRRRKVIRSKDKRTVVVKLAELKDELRSRGDLPTDSMTTATWFTYWVEHIAAKEVRPNTLDGYRRTVNNHIIPAIGKVKLDKLTAAHVRRVHDAILAKGLSSTTALLAHRIMAVSFKIAIREGRIGRNPAELTNAPRKAVTKLHALTLEEAVRMLAYSLTDEQLGARWAVALLTGARRGEALGLQYDRVTDVLDLSWQLLRLKKTERDGRPDVPADYEYQHLTGGLYLTRPKSSGSMRVIPMFEPLRGFLEDHIARHPNNPHGLLFTINDRPIGPDVDSANWRKALAAAGIDKDVRLHDARHTTADLLQMAKVPEALIMRILGHTSRATTRGYQSAENFEAISAGLQQFSDMIMTKAEELRQLEG